MLLAVWFILGYTLYSTALGFLGALASRMEEASNASTPVTMVAMISYFVAIFAVINDPDGTVAPIATFLPPSAPFVVPLRAAFDAIAPWEIGLSIVITLAAIWVLFSSAARVYAGAVLQTAGRMKLRDAWRSAGRVARGQSSGSNRPGRAAGVPEDDPSGRPARPSAPGR